jgi:hypothetical protein
LREEDLKILKIPRTKVLLPLSYATLKNPGLMNLSKHENHSTPLFEKFKRFNTGQL